MGKKTDLERCKKDPGYFFREFYGDLSSYIKPRKRNYGKSPALSYVELVNKTLNLLDNEKEKSMARVTKEDLIAENKRLMKKNDELIQNNRCLKDEDEQLRKKFAYALDMIDRGIAFYPPSNRHDVSWEEIFFRVGELNSDADFSVMLAEKHRLQEQNIQLRQLIDKRYFPLKKLESIDDDNNV